MQNSPNIASLNVLGDLLLQSSVLASTSNLTYGSMISISEGKTLSLCTCMSVKIVKVKKHDSGGKNLIL